ncbi:LLM class F420-dependent oxidoreductase [Mycolicibacterium litorale]|nr:LLM class F420-dependent oxidoreductase [Mycolicibacterium litorale]
MHAGIMIPADRTADNLVDDVSAKAGAAVGAGVRQLWISQQFDFDAVTLAALVGSANPGVGVGTSVVPINPRHPLVLATAVQTAQAATHGNFTLGLGLGVAFLEERVYGLPWAHTIARLQEYLAVLNAIRDGNPLDHHGTHLTAVDPQVLPVALAGSTRFPILVAAMGPQALRVTGEWADGTIVANTGPRTIESFIVPTIARAAAQAGRPTPRVVTMVSVAITDDIEAARADIAPRLALYDSIPSYQKVLAREGVSASVDLAAIGTEETVAKTLRGYLDAGATELIVMPQQTGPADLERIYRLTAGL